VNQRFAKGLVSAAWGLAAVGILIVLWELYKWVGETTNIPLPANYDDASMPHIWVILGGFFEPEVRGSDTAVWQAVAAGAGRSLLIAVGGFVIGVSIGLLLAILMERSQLAERSLLPYVIASQTVPLIALAPLVVGIGNRIKIGEFQWTQTQSVMLIAAYLAFFPISVGALRGLKAPTAAHLELMRSYAAKPNAILWKLRFPSSIPYLIPALKVSAAAAIVGTVVAEISTGARGGVGRLIVEYAREATSQPGKVYVAVFGAALLGLIGAGLVTLIDVIATRNLPREGVA